MQVLPLVAAFSCVFGLVALEHRAADHSPAYGLYFTLASECPSDMEDDRSIEVVDLDNDGRTYLNDEPLSRTVLRAEIASRMEKRNEPIIYIRGDDGLTYGDFLSFASDFIADTPTAMVALATTAQAGFVDPAERKAFWNHYRWRGPIPQQMQFGYCLPREAWNVTARGVRARN